MIWIYIVGTALGNANVFTPWDFPKDFEILEESIWDFGI